MLMFYHTLNKKNIPASVSAVQYTTKQEAKAVLKDYYNKHEGEDKVEIAIYDDYIDDNETTLADVLLPYIDFDFMTIYTLKPKRVYDISNAEHQVIFPFSKTLQRDIDRHTGFARVNIIDDITYFFVGHDLDK